MKKCSECKNKKPLSEFNRSSGKKDGLQNYCRQCQSSYHRKHEYGVSQEIYDRQSNEQNGLCYLCNQTCSQHESLSIDYCEVFGFRKLLCMQCLNFLQRFQYDPINIRQAMKYIRHFSTHNLPCVEVVHKERWQEPDVKTKIYIDREGIKHKWCNGCQLYKPAEQSFYPRRHKEKVTCRSRCIVCEKNDRWKQRYGINSATHEHWQLMQKKSCWICRETLPLCTDHEHGGSQKNRGLLCDQCNEGLGFANENLDLMLGGAEYLESYT